MRIHLKATSHRRVVPLATLPLLLISNSHREWDNDRPIVKTLPHKLQQAQRKCTHFFFPLRFITGAIRL